jgi:hypothetical protein
LTRDKINALASLLADPMIKQGQISNSLQCHVFEATRHCSSGPISNESANDSSPAAQNVVGQSIARDLARKVESAFFGATVSNGPSGLESVGGYQLVDNGSIVNIDDFSEATSLAENEGAPARPLHGIGQLDLSARCQCS